MKKRILVVVSEGGSESSFLKEFFKTHYGFKNSQLTGKGQEVLEKEDFFIFFSHPICINGNYGSKDGGDSSIIKSTTYIKVKSLIKQFFSPFIEESEFIYLIQTDINNKTTKEEAIKRYVPLFLPKGSLYVSFSSQMMETWFIAGLGEKLSSRYTLTQPVLKKCFKGGIDSYGNTKKELDSVLPDYISGSRNEIGREFGEYIDIEMAKNNSPSFKDFMEKISKIFS